MTESATTGHEPPVLATHDAAEPDAMSSEDRISRPGEARTFEEVYRDGFRFVWRSLKRLGVRDAQLDDAVQDVFVVVHRKLPAFEGRSTLRTWLFRIAMKVAKDYRRSARRRPTTPFADESIAAAESSPLERAAHREKIDLLHALLERLDDDKRAAFVLGELEGMSGPEMADALGIPVDTAYSRLRAAHALFEQAYQRHLRRGER
jgi:RNA polymerase sigma-70 factor (ECF subfamily)